MNLERQTGVSGLRGIAKERENILRPMLAFSKIEIIKFSKDILLPIDTVTEILKKIEVSGSKVSQVISTDREDAALRLRAVSFLQKLGLIRVKK